MNSIPHQIERTKAQLRSTKPHARRRVEFMTELRQRQPRIKDPGFLEFTRNLPCCVCGAVGRSQAAHIRMANVSLGKEAAGGAQKPDDRWATPLCGPILGAFPPARGCHAEQHDGNEREFWRRACLDPFVIAAWNFARYRAGKPEESPAAARPRKPKARAKMHGRQRAPRHGPKKRIPSRPFPKGKRKF